VDVRVVAVREGLEARLQLDGPVSLDEESLRFLENALEGLGGFVSMKETPGITTTLRVQFPMARSLRSFLIVEAGGQRIALPWSAVERIYATDEEPAWTATTDPGPVYSLASLFGQATPAGESSASDGTFRSAKKGAQGEGHPLAVLRCGSGSAVVSFDRIVWRENARLKPLPPRLYPVEEVLGGIVASDSSITLVVNPSALLRRTHPRGAVTGVDAS
jgi:chemotaxis protein histidine kinase CheA